MTSESLYDWDGINFEEGEVKNTDIFKNMHNNALYFFKVIRLLNGLHALVRCKIYERAEMYISELLAKMIEIESTDLEEKLVSKKVVSHVSYATIKKSLEIMDQHERAKEVAKNVIPLEMTTDIEKSTLDGIKSFVYYHHYELLELSRQFATSAMKLNPKCSFWNVVYALGLRKSRRNSKNAENYRKPSFPEKRHFYDAYKQNPDPYFASRLAICYKEAGEHGKTLQMFEELKQMHISTPNDWLRLVLGYINYGKFELAKECLDKAEQIDDSLSMLHHYKGLYYMKGCRNYDEAMIHLKKASDQGNYKAFTDYLTCLHYKNPSDPEIVKLMEEATHEREFDKYKTQITIAIFYAENLNDYKQALVKLRDTVSENPGGYLDTIYYPFTKQYRINILSYIKNDLLPKCRSMLDTGDDEAKGAFKFLEKLVHSKKNNQNNFKKSS